MQPLGQRLITTGFLPAFNTDVFKTLSGTSYLKEPGVAMLSRPLFHPEMLSSFLSGFDDELGFERYPYDERIPMGTELCKTTGQLCYLSFSDKRTRNADASNYFTNIKKQKHGAILEHAHIGFLFYGIDRSVTHELVRHRLMNYSQVSQRYVGGATLRFVMRPEWQGDRELEYAFDQRIDRAFFEYESLCDQLEARQQSGNELLTADSRTERRKAVRQAARACLPNETEAPIIVTGNVRAWRHFLEMRASPHAEVLIRALAMRVYHCLYFVEPILFEDYSVVDLDDGTQAVMTPFLKV